MLDMPSGAAIAPVQKPVIAEPQKVALGKALFNDARLSGDGTISCANCHDVRNGGDDGRRYSIGVDGAKGVLNTPTVLNSALNFAQFWDGRAQTVQEQIKETVQSPIEMGGDWPVIVRALGADSHTAKQFARLYRDGITAANIIDAIAAYLSALVAANSPFDRFLAGETEAVEEDVVEGYATFMQMGCISCHQGRNVGGNLYQPFGVMGDYFADRGDVTVADLGRYNVTGLETDRHRFKVPSLRAVAETAPYFHDGSAATLQDAVRTMVQYQLGRPATEDQIRQIVAFLESLSGEVDEALL